MSSGICRVCKNEAVCTYPHDRVISQCEEFAYGEASQVSANEALTDSAAGHAGKADREPALSAH